MIKSDAYRLSASRIGRRGNLFLIRSARPLNAFVSQSCLISSLLIFFWRSPSSHSSRWPHPTDTRYQFYSKQDLCLLHIPVVYDSFFLCPLITPHLQAMLVQLPSANVELSPISSISYFQNTVPGSDDTPDSAWPLPIPLDPAFSDIHFLLRGGERTYALSFPSMNRDIFLEIVASLNLSRIFCMLSIFAIPL